MSISCPSLVWDLGRSLPEICNQKSVIYNIKVTKLISKNSLIRRRKISDLGSRYRSSVFEGYFPKFKKRFFFQNLCKSACDQCHREEHECQFLNFKIMLQFILILLGLISNPNAHNSANHSNDGASITVTQSNSLDTGGDEAHTPKK